MISKYLHSGLIAEQIQTKKFLLFAIILITSTIYFDSLDNQLTTWDDHIYITQNADVKTLSSHGIGYTFKNLFTSYAIGNYHPLTMLSYSMEYGMFKLNPKPYHVNNLIFHILNALLVFGFIWLLTRQQWVAFITALLFAIHPMHVESVAWISGRKDVLYAFFYLSALCTYLIYLKSEKWKWHFYALTLFLFIFSLLSKAMAVTLPIVFFALDYFLARKVNLKMVLEKLPFLLASLIFGYIAIQAQSSGIALGDSVQYDVFDRFLFTCTALMMYLWKLIVPINLTSIYSYPLMQDGMYPTYVYLAPLVLLLVGFFIYRSKRFGRDVIFGFAFFIIAIALVLQVLPVGNTIIADRYTYLAYIGLFFILARWINNLFASKQETLQFFKIPGLVALVVFSIFCSYQSYQRTKVWHDSITLWTDVIEKLDELPMPSLENTDERLLVVLNEGSSNDGDGTIRLSYDYSAAYCNRGAEYYAQKRYEEAIEDYSISIAYNPMAERAYYNRGISYYNLGNHGKAIKDYTSAIQCRPDYSAPYYSRAASYYTIKKFQPALADALKAQQLGYTVDTQFIRLIQAQIYNQESRVL